MKARGVRDEIVLATKYTSPFLTYTKKGIQANYVGNNTKSLRTSVETSLRQLQTDYIDLVRSIKQSSYERELPANHIGLVIRSLVGLQHLH